MSAFSHNTECECIKSVNSQNYWGISWNSCPLPRQYRNFHNYQSISGNVWCLYFPASKIPDSLSDSSCQHILLHIQHRIQCYIKARGLSTEGKGTQIFYILYIIFFVYERGQIPNEYSYLFSEKSNYFLYTCLHLFHQIQTHLNKDNRPRCPSKNCVHFFAFLKHWKQ